MEKVYTIGEAAAVLGMPASTIRYYDKNGLFPDMARSQGGIRVFTVRFHVFCSAMCVKRTH